MNADDDELEAIANELEDAGLLTRRQAEAWTLRHLSPDTREQAAARMGISVGVFDDHRDAADRKVREARATVDVVDRAGGGDRDVRRPTTLDEVDKILRGVQEGRAQLPGDALEGVRQARETIVSEELFEVDDGRAQVDPVGPDLDDEQEDVDVIGPDVDVPHEETDEEIVDAIGELQEDGDDEDVLDCGHEADPDDVVELPNGERLCPDCAGVDDVEDAGVGESIRRRAMNVELPGGGATLEARREAVLACIEYLRNEGQAQKSDFIGEVYPDHDGRYGSSGGWWNAIGKKGLARLAEDVDELEAPGAEGAHTWYWNE